jgi:hypothetical protein
MKSQQQAQQKSLKKSHQLVLKSKTKIKGESQENKFLTFAFFIADSFFAKFPRNGARYADCLNSETLSG